MFGNLIGLLILIGLTALGLWLVRRAWRARRAIIRWPGVVLSGLLTLLLMLCIVLAVSGFATIYLPRGNPVTALKVAGTPEQVARGQHLASSLCASCHSADGNLPLSGGRDIGTDSPPPIGSYWSINLTPAGPLKDWSDGEIMRVLNEAVDRDSHPLLVMGTNSVRYLTDEDKQAVIAYLRSQPSIAKEIPNPPDQPNLLIAIMTGAGIVKPLPPLSGNLAAPRAETAEYGKYIVDYQDCRTCHGPSLTGGVDPITPHGPNLAVVQGWTRAQFVATMRTGTDPDAHQLSEIMPWKFFARMDDDELGAVYAYLKSLSPVASK